MLYGCFLRRVFALCDICAVLTSQRDKTISVRSKNKAKIERQKAVKKKTCVEKAKNPLPAVDLQSIELLESKDSGWGQNTETMRSFKQVLVDKKERG